MTEFKRININLTQEQVAALETVMEKATFETTSDLLRFCIEYALHCEWDFEFPYAEIKRGAKKKVQS